MSRSTASRPVSGWAGPNEGKASRGDPGYADQVIRLERFRAAHPEVKVECLNPTRWRGVVPQPGGEIVVTRTGLRELLDALDRQLGEVTGDPRRADPC